MCWDFLGIWLWRYLMLYFAHSSWISSELVHTLKWWLIFHAWPRGGEQRSFVYFVVIVKKADFFWGLSTNIPLSQSKFAFLGLCFSFPYDGHAASSLKMTTTHQTIAGTHSGKPWLILTTPTHPAMDRTNFSHIWAIHIGCVSLFVIAISPLCKVRLQLSTLYRIYSNILKIAYKDISNQQYPTAFSICSIHLLWPIMFEQSVLLELQPEAFDLLWVFASFMILPSEIRKARSRWCLLHIPYHTTWVKYSPSLTKSLKFEDYLLLHHFLAKLM